MPFGEWPRVVDLQDVDQSTAGNGKVLTKIASNGFPYSFQDPSTSSNVVDLTTNQTIGGIKTFSTAPVMSGASITAGTVPNAALVTTPVTAVTAGRGLLSSGSATPAVSLASYKADGTAAISTLHEVYDTITAAGVSTTITLSGAAAFASGTYELDVWDVTAMAPATVTAQAAGSFTFTSVNVHVYAFRAKGA